MTYLIVADWDENNHPTKTNNAATQAEADALVAQLQSKGFSRAFSTEINYRYENPLYLTVSNGTVTFDAAAKASDEAAEQWNELRAERDRLLAECDWVTTRAVDASSDGLGIQLPQIWVDYRQALRDLPANTTDPANPVWPTKPA